MTLAHFASELPPPVFVFRSESSIAFVTPALWRCLRRIRSKLRQFIRLGISRMVQAPCPLGYSSEETRLWLHLVHKAHGKSARARSKCRGACSDCVQSR